MTDTQTAAIPTQRSAWTPPPNWPAPAAGWTPPVGWRPDPAWGPAPEGWDFWSGQAASDKPAWYRRRFVLPLAAGLIGLMLGSASAGGEADAKRVDTLQAEVAAAKDATGTVEDRLATAQSEASKAQSELTAVQEQLRTSQADAAKAKAAAAAAVIAADKAKATAAKAEQRAADAAAQPAPAPQGFVQAPPAPAAEPAQAEPAQAEPAQAEVYYANCDAVRAAGAAPIRSGEPGYRKGLDRDGDGQGCGAD